ncbi:TetR/AcrR family transcriptional regulator [Streptomyces sp. 8K308]|uniref:TetR/AcrR family transcriptional regulator n=1 Tax=Streptomyces sp. 8K308 TaxID=2530388 RepID=UPI001042C920|nr:TetR/AcrR family transcriptional regulator [Streptomyces sp. 8K308]TDC18269.1 TetR/AcrR family transcriptional regulator [Streptomyces sp. 8K308]
MAAERRGGRDPEYLMELLWRTQSPGSRGPRGALSVDRVVTAAVEIADAEGLGAVSMRRVAERLGVTTMSLYTYVPSKDDLLDLMFDAASGRPDTSDWPDDWRGGLTAYARDTRRVLLASPWMLDVPIGAPPMGPNNLAWMEAALATMADTPLTADDMMGVLTILSGHVLTEVRQQLTMSRATPRTGVDYADWDEVYRRLLGRAAASGRYPTLARVVAAITQDDKRGPEEDFVYAVDFILDGVDALMRTRRAA